MNEPNFRYAAAGTVARPVVDEGLRRYMLRVYNYMASGVALTGIIAYLVASSPTALDLIFGTPLKWVVLFAPIGIALWLGFRFQKMSSTAVQAAFWTYAALWGVLASSYLIVYTGASVARVFFITAATFGAMSLYGYTTKRDLSSWGAFLWMGMIGVLIAGIANIFIASSALQFAISVIGVLVFVGFTAYDTQEIKETYYLNDSGEAESKSAIFGAFKLYVDFVGIFVNLMNILGVRNND